MQRTRLGWAMVVLSTTSVMATAAEGDFDSAWGNGGRLAIDITAGSDFAQRLLIQPDGKLLIAGFCNGHLFCATRLLANGSYDVSFGTDNTQPGRVVITNPPIDVTDATLTASGGSVFAGMGSTSVGAV